MMSRENALQNRSSKTDHNVAAAITSAVWFGLVQADNEHGVFLVGSGRGGESLKRRLRLVIPPTSTLR